MREGSGVDNKRRWMKKHFQVIELQLENNKNKQKIKYKNWEKESKSVKYAKGKMVNYFCCRKLFWTNSFHFISLWCYVAFFPLSLYTHLFHYITCHLSYIIPINRSLAPTLQKQSHLMITKTENTFVWILHF